MFLRLFSYPAANASFDVLRAQGTCLATAICGSPIEEANSAPKNPLAGFHGPLRSGEKRGKKVQKGEEKERKETDGGKWEKNIPEINFSRRP